MVLTDAKDRVLHHPWTSGKNSHLDSWMYSTCRPSTCLRHEQCDDVSLKKRECIHWNIGTTKNLQLLVLISPPPLAYHALVVAITPCHIYHQFWSSFFWFNEDWNFRLPTSRTIPCHGQLLPMKHEIEKAKRGPWSGMYQKRSRGCDRMCIGKYSL